MNYSFLDEFCHITIEVKILILIHFLTDKLYCTHGILGTVTLVVEEETKLSFALVWHCKTSLPQCS